MKNIILTKGRKNKQHKIFSILSKLINKCELKLKKLLKLACVAIHTRHIYLQFYFCAIDFHNFILQEEKNRADLTYDDIKLLHAASENTECSRIRNVNIQLRLNTRKTVPF